MPESRNEENWVWTMTINYSHGARFGMVQHLLAGNKKKFVVENNTI